MSDERRLRWAIAAAAALPPLGILAAERFVFGDVSGFPLDDSWIHLVYARGLAAGDGLAYAGGRAVPGSTAPLWTALLALLHILPGSIFVWTKLAGVALHAAGSERSYVLGRSLGLTRARSALAALLVAATGWLAWSALSGMEVPLFVALSTAAMVRHVRERRASELPALSLVLFAAAALARPEGLLLLALAALDRSVVPTRDPSGSLRLATPALPGWRRLAAGALAAAILLGAVALVYLGLWGSPLPTTLAAKSNGPARWIPELRQLRGVAGLLFAAQPWALLLAGGGAVRLLARLGTPRDRGLLLPLWTLALPVATAMLSSGQGILVGNFGRYFFPLLPCLALLAVLALEPLPPGWGRLRFASGRELPVLGPLAVALLFAPSLAGTIDAGRIHLQARANVDDSDVAAARFVVERLAPEATLAVCDIGAIAYLAPNPIFDLAGIVDPEVIAELRRAEREEGLDWMRALARQIERRRPDYVLLYPRWYPLLDREPGRFPVAHRLAIPDNVAMAGEELVLYQTPWTRYPLRPAAGDSAAAEPRSTP